MKSLTDSYVLNNGVKIPCVGYGTWQTPDGPTAVESMKEALRAGYRHIDTAAAYGNEASVGKAMRESGVPRGEIFLTSKLHNGDHGYEAAGRAIRESLERLGTDYLDLYLIHWPNPLKFRSNWQEANAGAWKAFEEAHRAGKIRALGISNFLPHHIEELLKTAVVPPAVNQIRLCPGLTQPAVANYCRARGILLEAYSPLGVGRALDVPELKALAEKYGKSVAQVCLRWSLQMGFLPLPKSVTPARIRENTQIFDFELSSGDVGVISGLKDCCGSAADPDNITW